MDYSEDLCALYYYSIIVSERCWASDPSEGHRGRNEDACLLNSSEVFSIVSIALKFLLSIQVKCLESKN